MTNENMKRAMTIRHMAETIFEQNMDIYEKIVTLDIEEFNSIHVNGIEIMRQCEIDEDNPEFVLESKNFYGFRIWRPDGVFTVDEWGRDCVKWTETNGLENFSLERIDFFAEMMDALREAWF